MARLDLLTSIVDIQPRQRMVVRALIVLLFCLVGRVVQAAETTFDYPTFTPLRQILADISRAANVPVCWDTSAGDIEIRIRLQNVEPLEALFTIASMCRCSVKSFKCEQAERAFDVVYNERAPRGCGGYTSSRRPKWIPVRALAARFHRFGELMALTVDECTNAVLVHARDEVLMRTFLRYIDRLETVAEASGERRVAVRDRCVEGDPLADLPSVFGN